MTRKDQVPPARKQTSENALRQCCFRSAKRRGMTLMSAERLQKSAQISGGERGVSGWNFSKNSANSEAAVKASIQTRQSRHTCRGFSRSRPINNLLQCAKFPVPPTGRLRNQTAIQTLRRNEVVFVRCSGTK